MTTWYLRLKILIWWEPSRSHVLTQVTLPGQIIKFLGKTKQIKKNLIKSSSSSANERGKNRKERKQQTRHKFSFQRRQTGPKSKSWDNLMGEITTNWTPIAGHQCHGRDQANQRSLEDIAYIALTHRRWIGGTGSVHTKTASWQQTYMNLMGKQTHTF